MKPTSKTIVSTLVLIAFSNILFSQEIINTISGNFHPWYSYESTDMPLECYTLVSDANLRDKPNQNASIVTKLPIASKVTIQEVTTDTLKINGFAAPWCKVNYTKAGKTQSGYLWGGTLAFVAFEVKEDYDALFGNIYLVGISKLDEEKGRTTMQLRVAKNNVELSKTEFQSVGNYGYSVEVSRNGNCGLDKVNDLVSVKNYFPACGYGAINTYFVYSDKKLTNVLELNSSFDAPYFSSEEVIFPSEKGGIMDHVVLIKSSGTGEDNPKERAKSLDYSVSLHKWDGIKLLKIKEFKK